MNNPIAKEIKLIAVYARVSTSAQEVQETIEAQLLQVHKFAEEHGYTIVKEYLDQGWSGDILARPALDELRIDAKKHIWEAVLIYDPDRLGRRYFYQELVIDELKQLGIEILFVTVPPVKDLNDRMMGGIRGLFAEYERAKISERFRMGKVNRVTLGHVLLSEAPYGYTYVPNMGKKGAPEYVVGHFKKNKKEAEVLKKIFEWVANDGLTLRGVVKKLYELGIKPRWSNRGIWNTSTLSSLLRNRTFIGEALWNTTFAIIPEKPLKEEKYRKIKKTSKRMRPKDEWITVKVSRIIEDDLFCRAGKQLRDNFKLMGRNKKNDYLLAGKIWCTCGRRRAGEGPQHGKHLYYRCTDRVYSFPLPRNCKAKGINARIADKAVWEALKEFMSTPEKMNAEVEQFLINHTKNETMDFVVDIEETKKEIAKLVEREKRYTNIYSEGLITIEKLKEYLFPLKEEMSALEKKLSQAMAQKPKAEVLLPTKEEIELFAKEATELLAGDLNFEAKKSIMSKANIQIFSTQRDLNVHGCINLSEIYVKLLPERWNSGVAKCGQIYTF